MSVPDHFVIDPDWESFASKNGYPYTSKPSPPSSKPIQPLKINVAEARDGQAKQDMEWAANHPIEAVGYVAKTITFRVRDGTEISVRVSYPSSARLQKKGKAALPVLFITHGGGWVQGSHLSEEAWLLWPLYEHFEFVAVSVEYRLAPEHQFPVWIEDSWDVLENIFSPDKSRFSNLGIELDLRRVILAGSSSGAGISAVLSHMCRDHAIPISGVILNVPVLCDYRHFPAKYKDVGRLSSYEQCVETYSSGAMVFVWNLIQPSELSGSDLKASPLLGECVNLPRHIIFVAGQDALRDEGIAYATKLKKSNVDVQLEVYDGVPHHFAQFSELKATIRFREHLRLALRRWLGAM
jgi:acetyl esterase